MLPTRRGSHESLRELGSSCSAGVHPGEHTSAFRAGGKGGNSWSYIKKRDSRYDCYDFKLRGRRYRSSTKETNKGESWGRSIHDPHSNGRVVRRQLIRLSDGVAAACPGVASHAPCMDILELPREVGAVRTLRSRLHRNNSYLVGDPVRSYAGCLAWVESKRVWPDVSRNRNPRGRMSRASSPILTAQPCWV